MTPKDFVAAYYPYAKKVQDKNGISAIAILAQAALESGWGEKAVGNNFFGIKDTDGVNGNEQLITTTEFLTNPNAKFPTVISKVLVNPAKKIWKYIVKDYFRKYNTAEQSFSDHTDFFFKNKRYAEALKVRQDPYKFIDAISAAGYATDLSYGKTLKQVAIMIDKLV